MTVQVVAQTIQFILAPVVMMSATGILLNGLLSRYAAVNDRLRAMTHERLDLIQTAQESGRPMSEERLAEIDRQFPTLLVRHRRLHDATLALYLAATTYVVSMFIIGLAAAIGSDAFATAALAVFLGGTAVLLVGLVFAVREVAVAQRAIEYEVRRVGELKRP